MILWLNLNRVKAERRLEGWTLRKGPTAEKVRETWWWLTGDEREAVLAEHEFIAAERRQAMREYLKEPQDGQ